MPLETVLGGRQVTGHVIWGIPTSFSSGRAQRRPQHLVPGPAGPWWVGLASGSAPRGKCRTFLPTADRIPALLKFPAATAQ